MIERQTSAIPIPLASLERVSAQPNIIELAAHVVMQFVIERRLRPKLFLLHTAKLAVGNGGRISARHAVTEIAVVVIEAARNVISGSNRVPRGIRLAQYMAGFVIARGRREVVAPRAVDPESLPILSWTTHPVVGVKYVCKDTYGLLPIEPAAAVGS